MTELNKELFLCRETHAKRDNQRDWFTIRYASKSKGLIHLGTVKFPKHCIGKKVKLKVVFVNGRQLSYEMRKRRMNTKHYPKRKNEK